MTDQLETGPDRPRRMPLGDYAAITAVVLVVLAVAAAAVAARFALVLVFVGFFLATGIEPAIRALHSRGLRRGLALALVVLGVLVVLIGLVAVLVVPAAREIGTLATELPARLSALGDRAGGPGGAVGRTLSDPANHERVQTLLQGLGTALATSAAAVFGALGALFGGVFAALTSLVLMIYFSLAMPRIRAGIDRLLVREDRIAVADAALGRVGSYVSGQLVVSAVAGIAAFAFFLVAGVPYPALLAVVVAVLDAVPQIGATLASVVGIAAALSVSVVLGVVTLIFFLLYQGLENYIIAPRVFSKAIELTPVAAFVAVLVGVAAGGVLGAMTALPLTAAGKVVVDHALAERAARRGVPAAGPAAVADTGRAADEPELGHA
ncbi:AI-2E family transporter [Pseudonocardia nematodicida]|uniref:AI-2E family transporter n=1 Tax=Pseudonocardia nematodicida TaxID=1206997 RepID=A0ABV1KBX7_9PSEU